MGSNFGNRVHKVPSYGWIEDAVADDSEADRQEGLAGFTPAQVEEVRCVVRMLPIFFTTILYWTIYCQVVLRTLNFLG